MLVARGSIGQSTRKNASDVPPSYAMRRCSRTHRARRTVPLLPTNANKINMLCIASTRNNIAVPIYDFAIANENEELASKAMVYL
jgi:hypothetical protein